MSREGARTGSALARGEAEECTFDHHDSSPMDANLVATVQRILKSPDSGIGRGSGDVERARKRGQALPVFAIMAIVIPSGAVLVTDVAWWWIAS